MHIILCYTNPMNVCPGHSIDRQGWSKNYKKSNCKLLISPGRHQLNGILMPIRGIEQCQTVADQRQACKEDS